MTSLLQAASVLIGVGVGGGDCSVDARASGQVLTYEEGEKRKGGNVGM